MSTVVLDDHDLDVLELVLGGALPSTALNVDLDPGTVLTDAENTPLARWDGEGLEPDRPFAVQPTPVWDPEVRRPARDVAEDQGRRPHTAVVLSGPPTWDEVRAVADIATDRAAVLVVTTSRGEAQADADRTCRAALAIARDSRDDVSVLVVPVPQGPGNANPNTADILRGYGLTRIVNAVDFRTDETRTAIATLADRQHALVSALYPPASATEVGAAGTDHGHGTVVLFTGLSGSGKSTIARALATQLEADGNTVTLLDGDAVRQHLSRGLGFSREDRELNLERIGYVASLVAHHGGIAIAAPIAPFAASRASIRAMAEAAGGRFILVYVDTPLDVCEARDRKGLYAKARAGEIADFTGISSPYEVPTDADVVITTTSESSDASLRALLSVLR